MLVKVFGPNLSSKGQAKGDMHVHAADCQDCRKYGPGKPMGGDDNSWQIEASSYKDVCVAVYPPGDFCYDADSAHERYSFISSLYFAPCIEGGGTSLLAPD